MIVAIPVYARNELERSLLKGDCGGALLREAAHHVAVLGFELERVHGLCRIVLVCDPEYVELCRGAFDPAYAEALTVSAAPSSPEAPGGLPSGLVRGADACMEYLRSNHPGSPYVLLDWRRIDERLAGLAEEMCSGIQSRGVVVSLKVCEDHPCQYRFRCFHEVRINNVLLSVDPEAPTIAVPRQGMMRQSPIVSFKTKEACAIPPEPGVMYAYFIPESQYNQYPRILSSEETLTVQEVPTERNWMTLIDTERVRHALPLTNDSAIKATAPLIPECDQACFFREDKDREVSLYARADMLVESLHILVWFYTLDQEFTGSARSCTHPGLGMGATKDSLVVNGKPYVKVFSLEGDMPGPLAIVHAYHPRPHPEGDHSELFTADQPLWAFDLSQNQVFNLLSHEPISGRQQFPELLEMTTHFLASNGDVDGCLGEQVAQGEFHPCIIEPVVESESRSSFSLVAKLLQSTNDVTHSDTSFDREHNVIPLDSTLYQADAAKNRERLKRDYHHFMFMIHFQNKLRESKAPLFQKSMGQYFAEIKQRFESLLNYGEKIIKNHAVSKSYETKDSFFVAREVGEEEGLDDLCRRLKGFCQGRQGNEGCDGEE